VTFPVNSRQLQVADAAAIVVLNDDGPAFRMPKSDDDHTSVNIPAVMVSKVSCLLLAWPGRVIVETMGLCCRKMRRRSVGF
jgi:hypothetical protein